MLIWMEGPQGLDLEWVYRLALTRGTAFVPGRHFFACPGAGLETMRPNFTILTRSLAHKILPTLRWWVCPVNPWPRWRKRMMHKKAWRTQELTALSFYTPFVLMRELGEGNSLCGSRWSESPPDGKGNDFLFASK